MQHLRLLSAVAVAAVVVTACGGSPTTEPTASPDASPTAAPSSTAPASPSASASPTESVSASPTAPFPANTERDTEDGEGDPVVVTDITVEAMATHDRVTLTTGGGGTAGWMTEYVDEPTAQGSGNPVEVAGDATLQVTLTRMAYPTDSDVPAYDGPERIRPDGTTAIVEVVYGTTFEGQTQLWIGTTDRLPFRVLRGDEPNTIVIDVVH